MGGIYVARLVVGHGGFDACCCYGPLWGAQAKSPIGNKADAKCLAEASKTLQPGFNHADYNFIGGTEGNDDFTGQTTVGPDVICGFGEDDVSAHNINDIFLGGRGYIYQK